MTTALITAWIVYIAVVGYARIAASAVVRS